jgi:hypothetical protein
MSQVFPPNYSFVEKIVHRATGELRRVYEFINPDCIPITKRIVDPDVASDIIYEQIISEHPCMIARYGGSELYSVTNYLGVQKGWRGAWDFIRAKQDPWWWIKGRLKNLSNNAGFFPVQEWAIKQYAELMLRDTSDLDVLASFCRGEYLIKDLIGQIPAISLFLLEPWFSSRPWTRALENKNVLVVHPYAELIEEQYYNHRMDLFSDLTILPTFNLKTIKAVQSLGGESSDFASWFEALDYMKAEIDKVDYDVCIIGCGAYGFHLAAHVKRTGKKAIHLGGVTQVLFGIKGNRWEDPDYCIPEIGIPKGYYIKMFNEYWTKPGEVYRPKNADSIEGACYW